jgi:tetratricopeptide (TPR) repeat protein
VLTLPRKTETVYQLWLDAVNKHDFQRAEELYNKLQKINPSTPGINFPMGIWYKEKGLLDEAKKAFLQALQTDPTIHAEIFYYLGNVEREQKNYEQSIYYYKEGLKIDPDFFEAHYNLGKVYALQGLTEEALKQFLRAQELNPEDADTYINIGVELSNLGRRKEALEMYEKALTLEPDSYLIYSNLGVEYTALGDFTKALSYHKKALQLNSFYGDGWYNLACTYARANDLENSLKALEKAVRLNGENIEYAKKDKELENIRNTEGYRKIIGELND